MSPDPRHTIPTPAHSLRTRVNGVDGMDGSRTFLMVSKGEALS